MKIYIYIYMHLRGDLTFGAELIYTTTDICPDCGPG
jgi:hypothetical protein